MLSSTQMSLTTIIVFQLTCLSPNINIYQKVNWIKILMKQVTKKIMKQVLKNNNKQLDYYHTALIKNKCDASYKSIVLVAF